MRLGYIEPFLAETIDVKHDHDPVHDSMTIAADYLNLLKIQNGYFTLISSRVMKKRPMKDVEESQNEKKKKAKTSS